MKDIKITLISEDKARLEKVVSIVKGRDNSDIELTQYWLYYHQLTYKSDAELILEVEVESDSQRIKSGCMACTNSAIVKSEGNKHTIKITYDTVNIGDFTKTVTFYYTKLEKEESIILKITGNVAR